MSASELIAVGVAGTSLGDPEAASSEPSEVPVGIGAISLGAAGDGSKAPEIKAAWTWVSGTLKVSGEGVTPGTTVSVYDDADGERTLGEAQAGNDGKWKLMVMVAAMDPVPCRVRVEGGVYAVAKVAGAADCDS